MAIYTERAATDPAMRAFDTAMSGIEGPSSERRIAEEIARRDNDLASRGLRVVETQINDPGSFFNGGWIVDIEEVPDGY